MPLTMLVPQHYIRLTPKQIPQQRTSASTSSLFDGVVPCKRPPQVWDSMFKDSSFFSYDLYYYHYYYYYFFSYDGIGYCIPSFLSSHWKSIDKSPQKHINETCEFVLLASSPSSSFWQVCSMITALGTFLFCVSTWRTSDETRQKTKNQMKHASLYC